MDAMYRLAEETGDFQDCLIYIDNQEDLNQVLLNAIAREVDEVQRSVLTHPSLAKWIYGKGGQLSVLNPAEIISFVERHKLHYNHIGGFLSSTAVYLRWFPLDLLSQGDSTFLTLVSIDGLLRFVFKELNTETRTRLMTRLRKFLDERPFVLEDQLEDAILQEAVDYAKFLRDAGTNLSDFSVLDYLIDLSENSEELKCNLKALRALLGEDEDALRRHLDTDTIPFCGQQLLILAVKFCSPRIVQLLLDLGVPVHADGLSWAVEAWDLDSLRHLLEKGADPNENAAIFRMSPLQHALKIGFTEGAELLKSRGGR
jgi:hypothetical protein